MGLDKWLCMFMGLASEISKVEGNLYTYRRFYSNPVKQSKAEIVARSWLRSPQNGFLRSIFTDRDKSDEGVILEKGITQTEAKEMLNAQESERFGQTKWVINRYTFVVDS